MIYLIHEKNKILEVLDNEFSPILINLNSSITSTLFYLANQFPSELLVWCQADYKHSINNEALKSIFHHDAIMASYSASESNYIPEQIGYVDHLIYIKVNRKVTYPTWLMSSDIGGIHAKLLNKIFINVKKYQNFEFFLNSIAKQAMPQGLFCYSEPKLLTESNTSKRDGQATNFELFKFVRSHYKSGWLFFLFLCFIIYERKFPIVQLINALRFSQHIENFNFNSISESSSKHLVDQGNIDVIIPTLGRKAYLYDVLKDLSKQTTIPKNVIIIEQNADPNSISELDYLSKKNWPFKIIHNFIHKTGVCNARNLALNLVESEWTFFGDDDIRFNSSLLEDALKSIDKYGVKAINTICLQPNEKQTYFKTSQTPIFGSGTSVVKSDLFKSISFNESYEFGFGEDSDFGMQIRNNGEDVVFISDILITHLKAPIGGYRMRHKNLWDDQEYEPKPSPTIMLFNQKYLTANQNLGYKMLLFIKFYKQQSIKNPFRYISVMKKRWNSSIYWSKKLSSKYNA